MIISEILAEIKKEGGKDMAFDDHCQCAWDGYGHEIRRRFNPDCSVHGQNEKARRNGWFDKAGTGIFLHDHDGLGIHPQKIIHPCEFIGADI